MTNITLHHDRFTISTDQSKLDIPAIHDFLSNKAYWSLGIPFEKVETSIKNSLCFGLYDGEKQIGLARVISDLSTIAYLGDVYILEEYRGRGLSRPLIEAVMAHPNLQGLRRWILLTGDAHELYRKFGWTNIADPTKWMEVHTRYS